MGRSARQDTFSCCASRESAACRCNASCRGGGSCVSLTLTSPERHLQTLVFYGRACSGWAPPLKIPLRWSCCCRFHCPDSQSGYLLVVVLVRGYEFPGQNFVARDHSVLLLHHQFDVVVEHLKFDVAAVSLVLSVTVDRIVLLPAFEGMSFHDADFEFQRIVHSELASGLRQGDSVAASPAGVIVLIGLHGQPLLALPSANRRMIANNIQFFTELSVEDGFKCQKTRAHSTAECAMTSLFIIIDLQL